LQLNAVVCITEAAKQVCLSPYEEIVPTNLFSSTPPLVVSRTGGAPFSSSGCKVSQLFDRDIGRVTLDD
jgi:hypothetical protein